MVKLKKAILSSILIFGFTLPCFCAITQFVNPAVVGCLDSFSTSIAGSMYQWDFGPNSFYRTASSASVAGAPVVFLTPGTRTIMVTITTGGGPVIDSLSVTVQPSPTNISISASGPLCQGSFITYTATPATFLGYAFFVNDSLKQLGFSNTYGNSLVTGDSVRVFGVSGTCFSNASPTLYISSPSPPQLISSVPSDTICGGQLVVFTAEPATYDSFYFYVGGSLQRQTSSNTWSTTTLYSQTIVHVTVEKNGCPSIFWSNQDTMFVKPTPAVQIGVSNSTICQGTPVTITATATQSATDSFYYFVNSMLVQTSAGDTFTSAAFHNNDTITSVAEYQGCYSQASNAQVITVNPLPTDSLTSSSPNDTICQGVPVTFTAVPGNYANYQFYDNAQSVQNGSSSSYVNSALTVSDSIYVIATNSGCIGPPSDTVSMVVNSLPLVSIGQLTRSDCVNFTSDTLEGFTPPTGGSWTGQGITNDSIGIFDPSLAGAGNHTLTYTYVSPSTGCSSSDTLIFNVNPLPVITVTPANPSVCQGQGIQLTASGADVYSWFPTNGLSDSIVANPIASPAQTSTYIVTGVDLNTGCKDSAMVAVAVTSGTTADFTFSQACAGQATTFNNTTQPTNGVTYNWQFGDGGSSIEVDPTHNYYSSDSFNVSLIAQLGTCFDTTTQPVFVYPAAVAAFSAFPLYSYNDSNSPVHFINQSTGAQGYNWDFGDQTTSAATSPYHVYNTAGQYTIMLDAYNQYGCNDTVTKVDYVTIYSSPKVFVPNVFTPGANSNNVLHVFAPGAKFLEFKVFDRLGELVYTSNNVSDDSNEGWDGTYRSKYAPEGVYVYLLQIVFDDNTSRSYKGSVTLLR